MEIVSLFFQNIISEFNSGLPTSHLLFEFKPVDERVLSSAENFEFCKRAQRLTKKLTRCARLQNIKIKKGMNNFKQE